MLNNRLIRAPLGVALLVSVACGADADLQSALDTITVEDVGRDIQVLASDEFEGRGPSSRGETKTIEFLKARFEQLGLEPGNHGSFYQEVPLVSITADPRAELQIRGARGRQRYAYADDFMAWTKRVTPEVAIANAQLVFVGYGTVAPEYGWNDYEGVDVRGKAVVMLVNDPGFATQDPTLFNGNAMTYYGRWTYKFEEAARQGAAAAFIVHETEPASYPWEVVRGSWSGPQFGSVAEDGNMSRVAIEGWLTIETARRLFAAAELEYDTLKARAAQPGFLPVALRSDATLRLRNTIARSTSNNVLAVLPGSTRADEYVAYLAHWDHFGRDTTLEGDQIYNGAEDNASGTAGLLEIAEAFASLPARPARSLLFLAVTAEEQGLLGSAYYASQPVYPTAKTVAAINLDGLNVLGRMRDISIVGFGNSELDDYLSEAAAEQARVVRPDPEPEAGYYYRSDHFNFAKVGVPALYTDAGIDHVEHGEEWSRARRDEYRAERYHKPGDEYDPAWDLAGAVDDLRLYFRVGYQLATSDRMPAWREGTEFKAVRDSALASLDN